MLLDEPFAGIDPIAVNDIRALVRHLTQRGIGVLITDHNVRETLDLVGRAYIIHDGMVLTHGSATKSSTTRTCGASISAISSGFRAGLTAPTGVSMAFTTKLELRQSHSLVMTPQLQQAIKLLQLSNMELAAFVEPSLSGTRCSSARRRTSRTARSQPMRRS